MASIRSPALTLGAITLLSLAFISDSYVGRKVGGRTEIPDVKTNTEVQNLGKFSVEEYSRIMQWNHGGNRGIGVRFTEVVAAQTQVVSGIKYYLKISATQNGLTKMFDSVVVVKPWIHNSKQLIQFAPVSTDH